MITYRIVSCSSLTPSSTPVVDIRLVVCDGHPRLEARTPDGDWSPVLGLLPDGRFCRWRLAGCLPLAKTPHGYWEPATRM